MLYSHSQTRTKGLLNVGDTIYGEIEQTFRNGIKDTIFFKRK